MSAVRVFYPVRPSVLLALDASMECYSVALARTSVGAAGPVPHLSQFFIRHGPIDVRSGNRMLPAVQEVLDEAQCLLQICEILAVGAGPGAFTGLRTAVGVAQGLAFALRVPVVPVNTLMACAQAAKSHDASVRRVLSAIDARMDQVYWAVFEWDDATMCWKTLRPACVTAPESVLMTGLMTEGRHQGIDIQPGREAACVTPMAMAFTLAGNAATVFGSRLAASAHAAHIDTQALPHARHIATLAWHLCASEAVPADEAVPDYIRNQVALTTVQRDQRDIGAGKKS